MCESLKITFVLDIPCPQYFLSFQHNLYCRFIHCKIERQQRAKRLLTNRQSNGTKEDSPVDSFARGSCEQFIHEGILHHNSKGAVRFTTHFVCFIIPSKSEALFLDGFTCPHRRPVHGARTIITLERPIYSYHKTWYNGSVIPHRANLSARPNSHYPIRYHTTHSTSA